MLYVGKAKNLKNRITNYHQWQQTKGKTRKLVLEAQDLKFKELGSELEALLVEAELIRLHQPPFNILLKDDKSSIYVQITKEEFPRVLTLRKKELLRLPALKDSSLGPFQSSFQLKQVLGIVRKIFPWCNQRSVLGRPCFYHHLELCPGVCVGHISALDYQKNIVDLSLFLRGKKKSVVTSLKKDLREKVESEQYEHAAVIKKRIDLIQKVTETKYRLSPDLVLPKLLSSKADETVVQLRGILTTYFALPKTYPLQRIECYDVSNISGTSAAVAMVVAIDGQIDKSEYRLFNIKTIDTPNDYHMLQEAILRRQNHSEWGVPDLIVIDGGKGQLRSTLSVLNWDVPVVSLAKKPDRLIIPILTTVKIRKNPPDLVLEVDGHNLTKYKSLQYVQVPLDSNQPAHQLLQQLRDEAHRFSKKQHQHLRLKSMFVENTTK